MIFLPRGGADRDEKAKDDKVVVPDELPILPLRGTVLYPDLILPIMVGRKRSVKLIDDAMDSDRIIGVVTQRRSEGDEPFEVEEAEVPGVDFCPLIGTMLTSAAHLLLAVVDLEVRRRGGEVVYCDTDSAFVT